MGSLQRRVALVLGVARSVLCKGGDTTTFVRSDAAGDRTVFVNIITKKEHQIGHLAANLMPRRIMTVIPALAVRCHNVQRFWRCRFWRGTGSTDPALLTKGGEAIPVGPRRHKTSDVDMDAMCPTDVGDLLASLHQLAKLFVCGHLPLHRHFGWQRLAVPGHEPGPQRKSLRMGFATGDAQAKNLSSCTLGRPNQTGKPHRCH